MDLNENLPLLGKWPRSSPFVQRALFACFSSFVFPAAGSRLSKIVGNASFLNASQRGLKEILFEALFG